MRYSGVIATGEVDLGGDRFARGALEQIAGGVRLLGFDPSKKLGEVVGAKFSDGGVEVEIEASEGLAGLYAVPAFQYDLGAVVVGDDGEAVFTEVYITCVGLTDKPADPNLTPLTSQS